MILNMIVGAALAYLGAGLIFAVPFVRLGAGRIDAHAVHGSWGFRLMIIPGTVLLWPLLARRWVKARGR